MRPLSSDDPARLGRYRMLAVLGEGGMGRVLFAVGPDGRPAAVKHVFPALAHDPVFRARFRREVAVSRLVSGAFTAAILDADPDADRPWLATLYVPGPSLGEVIAAMGPLGAESESLRHLASALATALTDIHRTGLVHRDLKPGNVLLTHDGLRVIDFGIARAAEASDITGTNALVGSPSFMSPEQAVGGELTPASDVFSLGSLLVTAATGYRPFLGASPPQTLYNIAHTEPDLDALSPDVREFVEPCLAKDPARRPTPQQLADHLGPVPPGTAPWPAAVHALIRRREAESAAVLSAPPPRSPRPASSAPPEHPAAHPGAPRPRRHWPTTVSVATLTVSVIAVLAIAVTSAIVAATGNGGAGTRGPTAPVSAASVPVEQALNPARLRRTDPCAVLSGDPVPSVGRLRPREPYHFGRCSYGVPGGGEITLTLGGALTVDGAESGPEISGLPVLSTDHTGGCETSVQLPEQPALGISVADSDPTGGACARTRAALEAAIERLRHGDVLRSLPAGSAVPVDVCSLVDDATARELLGTAEATATGLHRCEWNGTATLRLTLEQGVPGVPPDEEYEPVDLAGVSGHLRRVAEDTCVLTWRHREIDARREETVRLFHTGARSPCATARRIATTVAAALPPR